MTTRTFKQTGQAYGLEPTMIVAKIDGAVVYEGAVATVDAPIPGDIASVSGQDLFSWTADLAFTGTQAMEITITNNTLILTNTQANYVGDIDFANFGKPDFFGLLAGTAGANGVMDALSDISINDIAQPVERPVDNSRNGQWYWVIGPGKTFKCTVNIQPGQLPPANPTDRRDLVPGSPA